VDNTAGKLRTRRLKRASAGTSSAMIGEAKMLDKKTWCEQNNTVTLNKV